MLQGSVSLETMKMTATPVILESALVVEAIRIEISHVDN